MFLHTIIITYFDGHGWGLWRGASEDGEVILVFLW